jgi:hypothetical protein
MEGSMSQRRIAIAAFLVLVFVGAASAKGGAGSVFFGFSEPSWHPSFLPESSSSYQLFYFGGEGYGVDSDGVISGGFIMELSSISSDQSDMTSQEPLAFGIAGGAILGSRLVSEPGLHLDLAARVGVGGFIGQSGQYVNNTYGYSLAYTVFNGHGSLNRVEVKGRHEGTKDLQCRAES